MLRYVRCDRRLDLCGLHLHPVVEQTVEEQAKPIAARVWALEVDADRVHAVNLLVRLGLAAANRDDEDEQLGMLLDRAVEVDELENLIISVEA